ncbi:MAG TPA: DMT family transporter [Vicinamibacterales bacterium]|nr:DMT family transporter [Vicinamibacterales bacterium]
MGPALALASAILYGAGDFFGGFTARRANTTAAVLVSQAAGLLLLLLILPLLPHAALRARDLSWGVTAGLAGGVGVALLYRALAIGTMAVVAPVPAVCAGIVPVAAAALDGERVSRLSAAGIAVALVAIVLVSRPREAGEPQPRRPSRRLPPGLLLAFASGVAIGIFFLALARTSGNGGMLPLVAARSASVALFAGVAVVTKARVRMAAPTALLALAGGSLDMTANALYLVATHHAALSITATLASLYPASTIVLARVVLGERLSVWQSVGIWLALGAIVLIVTGGG